MAVGLVKVNTRTKGNRTKPATWKQRSQRREEASRVALTNAHSSLPLCSSLARALLISSACWNVTWNGTSPRSSLQANWKRSNRKRTLTPFSLHPSSLYLSLSSSSSALSLAYNTVGLSPFSLSRQPVRLARAWLDGRFSRGGTHSTPGIYALAPHFGRPHQPAGKFLKIDSSAGRRLPVCTCIECTQEENPGPLEGRNAVCCLPRVLGCLALGVPGNPEMSGARW